MFYIYFLPAASPCFACLHQFHIPATGASSVLLSSALDTTPLQGHYAFALNNTRTTHTLSNRLPSPSFPLDSYSVAASSWRGGKGDVLREFVDAANRWGIAICYYLNVQDDGYMTWVANYTGKEFIRRQVRASMPGLCAPSSPGCCSRLGSRPILIQSPPSHRP